MEICQIVDLKSDSFEEYREAHLNVPVESELESVGLRKIRVHFWSPPEPASIHSSPIRLVMTAEWEPTILNETFEEAMERYMTLPGVAEWEAWMDRLKVPLPGCDGPQWKRCQTLYKTPGS